MNNFQNYDEEEISFSDGVSLFYGPNGSGKSTILRAIFAGLYQTDMTTETPAGYNIDNLIRTGEDQAEVMVEFTHNGNQYTVEWEIEKYNDSGKTARCELETPTETIDGVRNVSSAIVDILGVDAKSFVNSVYVQQTEIMELISANASERKEIFDRLLGLHEIDEYIEKAEEARREIDKKADSVRTTKSELEDQLEQKSSLDELNAELEEVKENRNRLEKKEDQLEDRLDNVQDKLSQYEDAVSEQNNLNEQISDIESKISRLTERKTELSEKLSQQKSDLEELTTEINELQSERDKQSERADCIDSDNIESITADDLKKRENALSTTVENRKESLSESKSELTTVESDIESIQATIEEDSSTVDELETQISKKQSTLEEEKDKKEELQDEYATTVKEVEEQYEQLEETYTEELPELSAATSDLGQSTARERENDVEELVETVTSSLQNKTQTRTELENELSGVKEQIERIESQLSEFDNSDVSLEAGFWNPEVDLEELTAIDEFESSSKEVRTEIRKAIESESSLENLTDEAEKLYTALLKEQQEERAELEADLQSKKSDLAELENNLSGITKEITSLEEAKEKAVTIESSVSDIADLEEVYQSVTQQISELEDDIESWTTEQNELAESIEENKSELSQLEDQKESIESDIDEDSDILDTMEDNLEAITQLRETLSDLDNLQEQKDIKQEQMEQTKDTFEEIKSELSEANEQKSELEEKLSATESTLDIDLEKLEKKQDKLEAKLEGIQDDLSEAREKQTRLSLEKESIEENKERIDQLEQQIHGYTDYVSEMKSVVETYESVKQSYRENAVAYMNMYANDIFQSIYRNSRYNRIEITDEYDIMIHTTDNETINPQFSSGGEGAIINMAIRAGIYRVISEKSRKDNASLPPIILDEPTTFLDSGHIEKLDTLIETLQSWDVEQVFVVSHNDRLVDKADTVYGVSIDSSGRSTVTDSPDLTDT